MDALLDLQLDAIRNVLALSQELAVPVWLRGGWAVDFYLGRVTRPHVDIDWFIESQHAPQMVEALQSQGFVDVTTAAPGQQVDLVRGRIDHGFALLDIRADGQALVAGGPFAGESWPSGMLDGPPGSLEGITAPIISPQAQIEIKQMMPVWNPSLRRRGKDSEDIEALRREPGSWPC